MVKTTSTAGGLGSLPSQGTKILQAAWHSQKKKKKKRESVTYLVLFDKSAFGAEWDDRQPCNTQHFTMCQTYKGDSDVKLHNAQDGNIYDSKCRFTSKFTQLIGIISDQVGSTTKSLTLQTLPCSGLPR